MLIQNTNPVTVAPDSNKVRRGFLRDDLFVVRARAVHDRDRALADIVLPATMFMEHDDLYQAGGHSHIQIGPKLIEPPGECRSNHEVLQGLAARLGAQHPGFEHDGDGDHRRHAARLRLAGRGDAAAAALDRRAAGDFRTSHFLDGFAHPGRKVPLRRRTGRAIGPDHAGMPTPAGPLRRHRRGHARSGRSAWWRRRRGSS